MKRTKILATVGPATQSADRIQALAHEGVDAFRINMSHGDQAQWTQLIGLIREHAPHCAIVMDTRGPELRIVNVQVESDVKAGDEYIIATHPTEHRPHLTYPARLEPGHLVLIDDGAISASVESVNENEVKLRINNGGHISDRRKVTVPTGCVDLPILTEKDYGDIAFAVEQQVDTIALSFTQSAADVQACRRLIPEDFMIIAKIESQAGADNIVDILEEADGIMVARGDLGVEMQFEEVPVVQKHIISLCNEAAKPVIVATQMLESMIHNARPTRAETSDVANAIMDGADCVMLSAETAVGEHPVETVRVMARICSHTDPLLNPTPYERTEKQMGIAEAISHAVHDLSEHLGVDAIITATASGFTTRMVSRFRPHAPIIAVAHDEQTRRHLQFTWGVQGCVFTEESDAMHKTIVDAVRTALDHQLISMEDMIITTAGVDTAQAGSTNLIEVHSVKDLIAYHDKYGDAD